MKAFINKVATKAGMKKLAKRLIAENKGATLMEYLGLSAIVIVVIALLLGIASVAFPDLFQSLIDKAKTTFQL